MTTTDVSSTSTARPAARSDPALRDVGLFVGAVALARLATRYAPGWRTS